MTLDLCSTYKALDGTRTNRTKSSTRYPGVRHCCWDRHNTWPTAKSDLGSADEIYFAAICGLATTSLANEDERVQDWAASNLAWELADAISPLLDEADRDHLYTIIGSGESYAAIETMLHAMARHSSSISPELTAKLCDWLECYTHSKDAHRLHELLRTITGLR